MTRAQPPFPLGARLEGGRVSFCVWAPHASSAQLVLEQPQQRTIEMDRTDGYHTAVIDGIDSGQRYGFQLDDTAPLADPASRLQPDGVHGRSAVVETDFAWTDAGWLGPTLDEYVLYELHVGTFTASGTFAAAAERLPALRDLGVTAIELMPVAQFPGSRNWGYDGVLPYATQNSYGGPHGLKRFVDCAHAEGMAVCLDVVYNHLGPEGNHLARFGPYFTETYHTPWGAALNFDGPHSDHVREYFIGNALQWIDEFHIDALRLDAVHAILDQSAYPFLRELADRVHARATALGRTVVLIAESDLGDPRIIGSADTGGMGMDAQWLDDFHHSLHALLTGERTGYYQDFGRLDHLADAYRAGFVYAGQYSASRHRRHGAPLRAAAPRQLVVFAQNHDQIGNRMLGERLTSTLSFEQLKLCAAAVLLAPFTPLIFMGEEYGEVAPFPYFVSHSDAHLVEAVRRGRAEEFASFAWAGEPPDPQAESTFRSAVLDWSLRDGGQHARLLELYRELLRVRRGLRSLPQSSFAGVTTHADAASALLRIRYTRAEHESLLLLHFGTAPHRTTAPPEGQWRIRMDTAALEWNGPGRVEPALLRGGSGVEMAPHTALLLVRED